MSNSPINLMKQAMSTLLAQSTVAGQPDTKPVDKPLPQPHDDVSIPEQNSILLPSGYSKFSGSQLAELSERRAEFIQGYETLGQTEKKLSQSFNIAFISLILGDGGKYLTWSAKAIANAAMLPGGSELAVPVTKGDLFAIEGKYEEAVVEYEKAIQTLSIIGKKGEDVTAEISAIQGRMKQVLFADASVSLNQSRGQFDLPSRDRTVGNLKMIYQLDPSETNLAWIFMAYAKLGWDLYDLQGRVEGSEKALQNYQSEMWEHFIETGRGQLAYISNDDLLSDPSLSDTEFLHLLRVDLSISMAQMDLDLYRPEFERIVSEIKTMIETTLKDDAQEKDLQLADLYAHIGDTDKLRRNLFFAHSAFQTLKKFHPEKVTKEKLTKDITCLHRLFTLQRRDYSEKAKILAEAKSEITSLLKFGETEEALLFLLENAYLSADLNEDLSLQRFEMKLTTQEEFQSEVKRGYTKAIQLAKMNISKMKNPEMKARFVQMMLDVGTTLFEKELSESTLLRLQGETEKASKVKSRAKSKLDAEFETYGGSVDQIMLEELRGQADYSYAYFLFRSGEIRSSILHLMNIDQNYRQSSAKEMMYDSRSWVRKYGITTSSGTISSAVNTPSMIAALKQVAGQLDEQQGRALAACGIAAVGYIALDLVFGEKVSGLAVMGACTMGYAIDRAFVVGENWQQINDAYTSGISNVDTDEALLNAGLFAFDMGSIFVGGFAGRMAQEAILKGGNLLKGRALKWFIKRGALKGPWKRPVTGFFLREASFVGNAYVFNSTSKYLQGLMHEDTPGKAKEQNDLLASWLFVRFLPLFHSKKWNLGSTLIKGGAKSDLAAKFLINTGAAATAIQGALTATTDQDGKYMDRVARTFRDLVLLHVGSKGFETAINSKTLSKFGISLEKSRSEVKTDLELQYEAKNKAGKADRHERADWFLKRATEEAVHLADATKSTFQFFKQLGYDLAIRPIKGPKNVISKAAKPKAAEVATPEGKSSRRGPARWVDVIRTEYRRLKAQKWEELSENPDAQARATYLDAAKKSIAPWKRRGLYTDEAVEAAGQRLQTKPKEGERAPDTTIFKGAGKAGEEAPTTFRGRLQKYLAKEDPLFKAENSTKLPFSKRFKRNVHTLNFILTYPLRSMGRYVLKTAGKVGEANPRLTATHRVKVATKEVQREVVRQYIEDSPPMLSTLWRAIRGPEKVAKEPGRLRRGVNSILKSKKLARAKELLYMVAGDYFMPLFEFAHVVGVYYSAADFLAIDNDEDQEGLFDMDIDTLPGAAGFVMGSNFLVGKMMGITTLGGGLIAEVFKTMTWGMLVSMEGSDPWKYFTKKPSEIVWLHIEYFWVLMGQVVLFSGMHSKPGNPIYKLLTNVPVVRAAVPSLTRFHKYYTARSTFFKPDFVKNGRLVSLAAVGPFHMVIAFITKGKSYLDAHDYLMFHRLLKTVHLGIWLKPLGAKFNQAGTLGQFLERFTGMAADWIDGLLTPIKLGKGTYKGRLIDSNLSVEDVTEASEQLEAMAETNHVVFRRATTSLDVAGPLGAAVQEEAGYPAKSIWRTGWRVEVEGVAKHLEIMEDGIKSYPIIAINDAMSMDYTVSSFGQFEDDVPLNADEISMVARSMEIKMLANQAVGESAYRPYYDLVYKNTDREKQAYWDSIPNATDKESLLKNIGRLNDGDYDVDGIISPLLK